MTYEQMIELGEKVGNVDKGMDKNKIDVKIVILFQKLRKIIFSKKMKSFDNRQADKLILTLY